MESGKIDDSLAGLSEAGTSSKEDGGGDTGSMHEGAKVGLARPRGASQKILSTGGLDSGAKIWSPREGAASTSEAYKQEESGKGILLKLNQVWGDEHWRGKQDIKSYQAGLSQGRSPGQGSS